VAVVDLALPDGDGSELIGELRRANPGVSALALSATIGSGRLDEAPLGGGRRGAHQGRVYPDHRRGGKAPSWWGKPSRARRQWILSSEHQSSTPSSGE
jgi:hypothetical protein